jgi:hypothetical protein
MFNSIVLRIWVFHLKLILFSFVWVAIGFNPAVPKAAEKWERSAQKFFFYAGNAGANFSYGPVKFFFGALEFFGPVPDLVILL